MLDFQNFQLGIISLAVRDTEFLKAVVHKVRPEDFKNRLAYEVYGWVMDYFIQYKSAPGNHIQELLEEKGKNLSEEEYNDFVFFLDRAADAKPNREFILNNVAVYIRRQAIDRALDEASLLKEENKLDDAIRVLKESFAVGIDSHDYGLDFFSDKTRYIRRGIKDEIVFKTMLPEVDSFLGGGLKTKWLGMTVATMKRGKSWFLCHLARSGIIQGKNVLYVTLEMTKEEVQDRMDMMLGSFLSRPTKGNTVKLPQYVCGDWHARKFCRIAGKMGKRSDCGNCHHRKEGFVVTETKKFKTLESSKNVRKVVAAADMFGGRLFIKECTSRKTNIFTLEGLLDDLISFKDFYPEVVLLDYADLMSSRKPHKEKRDSLDEIYKDLKDIAKERDCLVFTASQAIRAAIDKSALSQKDVAEDIRKFAHIDVGFMMGSTASQRLEGVMNFVCAAFRHGRQDWAVELLQCYDIGQFCLDCIVKEVNPDDQLVFDGGQDEDSCS